MSCRVVPPRGAQRDAGGARRPAGKPAVDRLAEEVGDQLSDELIDELLAGARTQAEIVGPGGLLGDLTRRLVECAMSAELSGHLGYEPGQAPPGGADNAQGHHAQDAADRARRGADRGVA